MPSTFKFLCQNGAGYDPIDVAACTAHDIRICNVPGVADDATADTAIFLILGTLRALNTCIFNLREGTFKGRAPLGYDPYGKTLGILGMGRIGLNIAKKVLPFGMKIQYYNRKQLDPEMSGGAKYVSFDELLATSDVLSLNLPLNVRLYTHRLSLI
jgi:lactate dehydrogenase-like 2-hydroxyacid dehydrogenase